MIGAFVGSLVGLAVAHFFGIAGDVALIIGCGGFMLGREYESRQPR